jgi:CheY-like chemotaxis protein
MGEDGCPEVIEEYLMAKAGESCVLPMDGDPSSSILLSRYLENAGFEAFHAEDRIDALEKTRNTLPKVIISNREMPRMSGLEFIEVGRRRFPSIGVATIRPAYRARTITAKNNVQKSEVLVCNSQVHDKQAQPGLGWEIRAFFSA